MGKRKDVTNTDDEGQEELDLAPADDRHGTLTAPADGSSASARIDGAGACESDAAHARRDAKDAEDGPVIDLPAFAMDGGWGRSDAAYIGVTPMAAVRFRRLAALGATVAFAAALGALAGSLATGSFGATAAHRPESDEAAMKVTLERVEQELTSLRASLETSADEVHARTKRIAERLDRSERAQAEPAQKLAKIAEAVERLERRGAQAAPAAAAADVTGSIGEGRPGGPDAKKTSIVNGWVLYHVRDGIALIEGRGGGFIEVEPGDILPGLGRVETIRKQDGRWVVVTSRGLVVQQR